MIISSMEAKAKSSRSLEAYSLLMEIVYGPVVTDWALYSTIFVAGVLRLRVQIVEIIRGSAVTIQALHSDVILHVPDGVYGIILGNIHTDHWRFTHLVKDTDCIIGPICDYHIFNSPRQASERKNFIIEIPHIVMNIEEVNGKIQVMRQPGGSPVLIPIQPQLSENKAESNGAFFSVGKSHIKIFTPHFSRYIVTAKAINCCSGSAEMLIFSKMDMNGAQPLFHVNIYLCSLHYVLQDYSQVCFGLIKRPAKFVLFTHTVQVNFYHHKF